MIREIRLYFDTDEVGSIDQFIIEQGGKPGF